MRTEYSVLGAIVFGGFIIFLIWNFQIPIIQNISWILFFMIGGGGLIGFFYWWDKRNVSNPIYKSWTTFDAFRFLQHKWEQEFKEKIKWEDSKGVPRWFGDKLFYGFRISKGKGAYGQTIVAVVSTTPPDVMWEENPTSVEIRNPFLIMSSYLQGSPVKNPPVEYTSGPPQPASEPLVKQYFPMKEDDEIEKFRKRRNPDEEDG
jgi:hypothetical protein